MSRKQPEDWSTTFGRWMPTLFACWLATLLVVMLLTGSVSVWVIAFYIITILICIAFQIEYELSVGVLSE